MDLILRLQLLYSISYNSPLKINYKQRGIWKNLVLALAYTPGVLFVGSIVLSIIWALVEEITKLETVEFSLIVIITGYVISLLYVIYEPKFQQNRKRKEFADALILHWKFQLMKQNKTLPLGSDIESLHEMLIDRIKVWGWSDPKLWEDFFPDEKYSEDPFEILNELMASHERFKEKIEKISSQGIKIPTRKP